MFEIEKENGLFRTSKKTKPTVNTLNDFDISPVPVTALPKST